METIVAAKLKFRIQLAGWRKKDFAKVWADKGIQLKVVGSALKLIYLWEKEKNPNTCIIYLIRVQTQVVYIIHRNQQQKENLINTFYKNQNYIYFIVLKWGDHHNCMPDIYLLGPDTV